MEHTDLESRGSAESRDYTSTVSAEYAERVRQQHESAYEASKARVSSDRRMTYLGTTLVTPPEVPPINPLSHLLGEAVLTEVGETDRVLDMGTGSGVNAMLAASTAREVVDHEGLDGDGRHVDYFTYRLSP